MKTYPSIKQSRKEFKVLVFDKLDGSNLRISWDTKSGWYDFATRTRSIPTDHSLYGRGYIHFLDNYADEITQVAAKQSWKRLDAFFEFHGPKSFAGQHDLSDNHIVTLLDLAPNTRSLLYPQEFLDLFGHLSIPKFLGEAKWNEEYIEEVKEGRIEGITFEGVVAKAIDKHRMAKAKTRAWVDRVLSEFGSEEAQEIIRS